MVVLSFTKHLISQMLFLDGGFMKLSKYNIYKKKENSLFLVNTLTGSVANIFDPELLDIIKRLRKKENVEKNSDAKNLFDLGFLKEDEDNECLPVDKIIQNYKNNELTLTLFTTRQCNFRCVYCYEKFNDTYLSKHNFETIMSFIQKCCEKNDIKKIRINLFGGEPLLNYTNIIFFLNELNEFCKESDINVSVGMTTNGYLLKKDKYENLLSLGLKDVQITLDGFEQEHNQKRYLRNKGKTFRNILQNLDDICDVKKHSKILIRTNFDADSLQQEKKFLLYLNKRYAHHIVVHYEAIKKWNDNYKNHVLDSSQEHHEIVDLIQFCRENGIHDSYYSHLSHGRLACVHAQKNSFIVDANMNVLNCTIDLDHAVAQLDEDGNCCFNENHKLKQSSFKECDACALLPMCLYTRCPASRLKRCDPIKNCKEYIDILDAHYNTRKEMYHDI